MSDAPTNRFIVLDYSYADPGEPIRTGQTSSDENSTATINAHFNAPPRRSVIHYFPPDRPADKLAFEDLRRTPGFPSHGSSVLSMQGRASGGFAGFANFVSGTNYANVAKLGVGELVSTKQFITTASLPGYFGAGDALAKAPKA